MTIALKFESDPPEVRMPRDPAGRPISVQSQAIDGLLDLREGRAPPRVTPTYRLVAVAMKSARAEA